MATIRTKSGFESWRDGIDNAVGNTKWNSYDCEIQLAVNEFNRHLSGTDGYSPLDWQFVKAMTWVESGAGNPKWKNSPIQIGNRGDLGLGALLSGKEGGDLILPPHWQPRLTFASAQMIPSHNIRAGIGYLLMKMANFDIKSISDADAKIYDVTVKAGDSLDKIAKAQGSTLELMKKLNPTAHVLRPGQVLKYQKAVQKKVIVGWKPITTSSIASYYNGGGDSMYKTKLDYALAAIRKSKGVVCSH
jgi:hypothetical protein